MKRSSKLLNEVLRLQKEAREAPKKGVDYDYLVEVAKKELAYYKLNR